MTADFKQQAGAAGIDIEAALARLGGDEDLFLELSGVLIEESPQYLSGLRAAVESERAADLRAVAHKAKGALGIFGCQTATALASELEGLGMSGDIGAARSTLPRFESELRLVLATLSRVAGTA